MSREAVRAHAALRASQTRRVQGRRGRAADARDRVDVGLRGETKVEHKQAGTSVGQRVLRIVA